MLDVKKVVSGYTTERDVLHGVSMRVEEGKIVAIVGPNGSGKSTLLKTVIGILKPRKGKVILNGEDITGSEPRILLKKGVAMIPQGRIVFPEMTVEENIEMGGYTITDPSLVKKRLKMVYEMFEVLEERKNIPASNLSGGEQTMLCMVRALLSGAQYVLFDDPSLGLAPKVIDNVYEWIKNIKREGRAIVIVEQNVRKVLSVADYVYVLDLGQNKYEGTPKKIQSDKQLIDLYLGVRA